MKETNPWLMGVAAAAPDQCVEIWPENWSTFILFSEMQTQWRAGGMGLIGLDYGVLFQKMDRMKLTEQQYDELEHDIRVMEYVALAAMNEKKD